MIDSTNVFMNLKNGQYARYSQEAHPASPRSSLFKPWFLIWTYEPGEESPDRPLGNDLLDGLKHAFPKFFASHNIADDMEKLFSDLNGFIMQESQRSNVCFPVLNEFDGNQVKYTIGTKEDATHKVVGFAFMSMYDLPDVYHLLPVPEGSFDKAKAKLNQELINWTDYINQRVYRFEIANFNGSRDYSVINYYREGKDLAAFRKDIKSLLFLDENWQEWNEQIYSIKMTGQLSTLPVTIAQ